MYAMICLIYKVFMQIAQPWFCGNVSILLPVFRENSFKLHTAVLKALYYF